MDNSAQQSEVNWDRHRAASEAFDKELRIQFGDEAEAMKRSFPFIGPQDGFLLTSYYKWCDETVRLLDALR